MQPIPCKVCDTSKMEKKKNLLQRICFVVFIVLLFSGCAVLKTFLKPKPDANFTKVARLGIKTNMIDNELVVNKLENKSPALIAGVKCGDVIHSLDGIKHITEKEFYCIMNNMGPGEHVLLVINRNGRFIEFDIEPTMKNVFPTQLKLQELLYTNNKITVAVIVSEVKNIYPSKDWSESMRNYLHSFCENYLLSNFAKKENFSIVDRKRLQQIFMEYELSQTGLISDELRVRIGKMTGTTHLYDVSFSRFKSSSGVSDLTYGRLIDIETGKILSIEELRSYGNVMLLFKDESWLYS